MLKRLVCQRERPSLIYLDNAKTFWRATRVCNERKYYMDI